MKKIFLFITIFIIIQFVLAQQTNNPDPFDQVIGYFTSSTYQALKCGTGAVNPFQKIIGCFFDVLKLLKSLAIILLVISFIAAAIYLISTPFFGLKQISTAWKILIWAPIGLVIVLLGDLIRAQIERIIFGK